MIINIYVHELEDRGKSLFILQSLLFNSALTHCMLEFVLLKFQSPFHTPITQCKGAKIE